MKMPASEATLMPLPLVRLLITATASIVPPGFRSTVRRTKPVSIRAITVRNNHAGRLQSELGRGTRTKIKLPIPARLPAEGGGA
jgi:hypothetical protein